MNLGIVASQPTSAREPNGPTKWVLKPESSGIPAAASFLSVATNGTGTWVASANIPTAGRKILSSVDDGETWTTVNDPNTQYGTSLIRYVDGYFWAMTYFNSQTTSYRSLTGVGGWTPLNTATGVAGYIYELIDDPNNENWVWLAGADGIRRSTTGVTGTWTNITGSIFNMTIKSLATDGNGNWVCVGGGQNDQPPGRYFTSSNNGGGWTASVILDNGAGARFDAVTHTGTHWVITSNNKVWISTDMANWTAVPVSGSLSCVAHNPADGSIVAAGSSLSPAISRDSITTWQNVPVSGQTFTYTDIACSPTKWIIVGTRMVIAPIAKG